MKFYGQECRSIWNMCRELENLMDGEKRTRRSSFNVYKQQAAVKFKSMKKVQDSSQLSTYKIKSDWIQ